MNFHRSDAIHFIIFDEPFLKNKTLIKNVTNYLLKPTNDTSHNLWFIKSIKSCC